MKKKVSSCSGLMFHCAVTSQAAALIEGITHPTQNKKKKKEKKKRNVYITVFESSVNAH